MPSPENSSRSKLSRRGFLIAITGSAVAAAAGCRPDGLVVPTPYVPGSTSVPATAKPLVPTAPATVAAATAHDATYGDVTFDKLFLTDVDKLYDTQYDYSQTPQVDAKTWALKIDGLVDSPMTLDYKAVQAFPSFEDIRT